MSLLRLIAKLEIKGNNVVKPVRFEGLRVMGKPAELAAKYAQNADELLYIDTVASLYGRNQLEPLLEETVQDVFVPICVGGGVQSIADVRRLLRAGADKIAINTAAIKRPQLIKEITDRVGSQAIVVSIEAKRREGGWEAYTDNGRERTGKDAVRWAFEAVELGAGEILLTSVDSDGTRKGFDLELIKQIAPQVPIPVTVCGGMGSIEDARLALNAGGHAIACASVLHYGKLTMKDIQDGLAPERQLRHKACGSAGSAYFGPEGRVSQEGA